MAAAPAGVVAARAGGGRRSWRTSAPPEASSWRSPRPPASSTSDDWEILPFTPLLGAGDRQRCENWMIGDVVKEPRLTGGLGHFVYEELKESTDSNGVRRKRRSTRNRIDGLHGRHGGVDPPLQGDLPPAAPRAARTCGATGSPTPRRVPWRSRARRSRGSTSCASPTTRTRSSCDSCSRRRSSTGLPEHPLAPGFELRGGTLVVFVPRPLEDGGKLTFLLDATREIAQRVLDEVREATERIVPKTRPARRPRRLPPGATKTAGL